MEFISIPAYWISILTGLGAIEYIGRFLYVRPRNYLWLGKALPRLAACTIYLLYYFENVPSELRHTLGRYAFVWIFATEILYFIVEHIQQWRGDDKRNSWIGVIHRHAQALMDKCNNE